VETKSKRTEYQVKAPIATSGRKRSGEAGQAIVEYVLLLSIILGMTGVMITGVRKNRDKMWKRILCEVSAACPDCKSTASAKAALPNAGVSCKN
jgi:hypothetical protein